MAIDPATLDRGAEPDVERALILAWRFDVLRRAGYARDDASLLAARHDVDLHVAAELLEHGCPTRTALAILL